MTVSVTVAIPTFNQVSLIQRAIDSVLAQDVEGLEVVVYDDSTNQDYSDTVAKYLDLPNFTYKKNVPNLGMAANYRQGLQNANGEFFLNLDGDDFLSDPSFLRKATDLLCDTPNAVVVIGGQRICDEAGHELKLQRQTSEPYEIVNGLEFFARSISAAAPVIPHLATVVRTKVAKSIGYYTADLINTDLHSVRRLFLKGDVILIDNICGVWSYGMVNTSLRFSAEKHSQNILSLVEPFDEALQVLSTYETEKNQHLVADFRNGIKKYHNDIYAICLRGNTPISDTFAYQKAARKLDYFSRLQIAKTVLWPDSRIIRNLLIRLLLGQRAYVGLANKLAKKLARKA
jgi:glycosyltransferase involved in cell wall biosynthesis